MRPHYGSAMRRRRTDREPLYTAPGYLDLQARLAANVRRLRAERGWTQEAAADACGMAARVYQRVEAADGNVTFATLARLATGFGVDAADLVRASQTTATQTN